jgi:hypothetical protein
MVLHPRLKFIVVSHNFHLGLILLSDGRTVHWEYDGIGHKVNLGGIFVKAFVSLG